MLQSLALSLFLETAEPSYGTFSNFIPQSVVAASMPNIVDAKKTLKKSESLAPVISAQSVYSVDLDSGFPLFAREIFVRRPIASIAKLVTAMVILKNHQLNEIVTVSRNAATQEGSSMHLKAGEKISLESAMMGMLINSGNDAAVALAEHDSGTEAEFVKKLNIFAESLNLKNTHFSNAKGFDDEGNYSTAFDTMIFSNEALKFPFITKTVSIKKTEVKAADEKFTHELESTDELLENPYWHFIGLKTGNTPAAGESFVSLVKAPNEHKILTVLLNSPSRFKETKILIDWILHAFTFN